MVPIPQYPLYTATLAVLDAKCVPYYLDESKTWSTDLEAIMAGYEKAKSDGIDTRAIVVINPGNPTGASLTVDDIKGVIEFAAKEKLVIMADEVYQTNVFVGKFHSFKGVLREMQRDTPATFDNVELVSLHSTSKGMVGECGHRGGYFELVGFDPLVVEQIYKFVSISLCAPVVGQCVVEMMVNPPKPGEASYEQYRSESEAIFAGLQQRATALHEAFQKMEGVECRAPQVCLSNSPRPGDCESVADTAQGSMYLFPTIRLPSKAIEQAQREERQPDEFYAFRLLNATGICIVPGSGFGQKPGTLHFRTTFLAPGTEWVSRIAEFHERFMKEFS
jgi:alanine transaminase